jgi:hypothetical protein
VKDLVQDLKRFKEEQALDPKRSFRYEFENFTLDFLPELKASLRIRPSFNRKETVTLNDTEIPFYKFEDLLADKKPMPDLRTSPILSN